MNHIERELLATRAQLDQTAASIDDLNRRLESLIQVLDRRARRDLRWYRLQIAMHSVMIGLLTVCTVLLFARS